MQPALKPNLYQQIEALPDALTGEILNGQIHTMPRPSGPHAHAETGLAIDIGSAYGRGRGSPGGWWILVEPEVHFVRDLEVAVPDLAGWRRERMPQIPQDQRFEVTPDWVCEVLSPSTASKDRDIKMPIYAHYGVTHARLLDPKTRTLEAYVLDNGQWRLTAQARGGDVVPLPPFEAVRLDLASLLGLTSGRFMATQPVGLPRPMTRTSLLIILLSLSPGLHAEAKVTLHQNPDTRLITWSVEDTGFSIELIQLLPDYIRAIYSKHKFPSTAVEDIASYCVFGTIVRNTADEPLRYRVADWRYIDEAGEHPVKTKTEWLEQWRKAGVVFSWTLLPDTGDFAVGDWQQGFTTVETARSKPFTFVYSWTLDGVPHSGKIENMHCAPEQLQVK